MEIYLAGPLFTQAERRWMRELSKALESYTYKIFLPQDDAELPLLENPPNYHGAFELCRDAVDRCDLVVAVLDGADADSGTAWECGYAYARNKPTIVVRTDFRGGEDGSLNLMLRRSADRIIEHPALDEEVAPLAASISTTVEELS